MASSKEAAAQNGEQAAGKVKLEGEALKDAIKKQVCSLCALNFFSQTCDLLSTRVSGRSLALAVTDTHARSCNDIRKQQDDV